MSLFSWLKAKFKNNKLPRVALFELHPGDLIEHNGVRYTVVSTASTDNHSVKIILKNMYGMRLELVCDMWETVILIKPAGIP